MYKIIFIDKKLEKKKLLNPYFFFFLYGNHEAEVMRNRSDVKQNYNFQTNIKDELKQSKITILI